MVVVICLKETGYMEIKNGRIYLYDSRYYLNLVRMELNQLQVLGIQEKQYMFMNITKRQLNY